MPVRHNLLSHKATGYLGALLGTSLVTLLLALRHINRVAKENANEIITVVLPEFIPAKWWQHILHNQSSLLLKGSLLFKRGVIVTSVPYHLER